MELRPPYYWKGLSDKLFVLTSSEILSKLSWPRSKNHGHGFLASRLLGQVGLSISYLPFFHGQIPLRQFVTLTRNAKRGKYFPPIWGGGGGGNI
jgi:hypothetical protein